MSPGGSDLSNSSNFAMRPAASSSGVQTRCRKKNAAGGVQLRISRTGAGSYATLWFSLNETTDEFYISEFPDGKVHFETVDVMRVRNGKITDHWGVANLLSLAQQLGFAPALDTRRK